MATLLSGPVELSEAPTTGHTSQFVGTMLRLVFRVSSDNSDVNQNRFPEVQIVASRIGSWHPWQQHEVLLNGHLVGTLKLQDSSETTFTFPFQPKILKVDANPNPWEVLQENVNELIVKLGSGGFGLNDSFDVVAIALNNVDL